DVVRSRQDNLATVVIGVENNHPLFRVFKRRKVPGANLYVPKVARTLRVLGEFAVPNNPDGLSERLRDRPGRLGRRWAVFVDRAVRAVRLLADTLANRAAFILNQDGPVVHRRMRQLGGGPASL